MLLRLALYQPEIPQNTGTLMRLAACLRVGVDLIEPCSFVFSDRRLKRAGMDYIDQVDLTRHSSWERFQEARYTRRVVLLTTDTKNTYLDFQFESGDILLLGQESQGVPTSVSGTLPNQVTIPMIPEVRSLNQAVAGAMVVGEALRQLGGFPT